MQNITINDSTLRDGNHAIKHQLSKEQIAEYCKAADSAGISIVEVGHGNGLGASSLQVGLAKENDKTMLCTARENLHSSKLGIHVIPGFATIERDLKPAIEYGVDVFRVASHCTEADTTQKHIGFIREQGKEVFGILMMSHMAPVDVLVEEALKMESYGTSAVVIMDSSGTYLPRDVTQRITALRDGLKIDVGFHAHNNLGLAVANSIAAVEAGASILDGSSRGFGAGAGNTQLEVLVAVLAKYGYDTGIDLYKMLDVSDLAEKDIINKVPTIKSTSIVSGVAGVFSGFSSHVERLSKEYSVDPRDVFFKLGERKAVAGQEDLIVEVVLELVAQGNRS